MVRAFNIYSATADNQLLIAGPAPSVSLADALTGATYQAKFGLATGVNQFVTNSVAGDFAISSQGTSNILFGINGVEAMRVFGSTKNVSIGGNSTDLGFKLYVNGTSNITGQLKLGSTITNGTYTYTLPSASGTLALTSDIPSGAITGTGTTNYLPKFTGASTIGNSAITDDGTTVSLLSRALSGTSATFSNSGATLPMTIFNTAAGDSRQLRLGYNDNFYWEIGRNDSLGGLEFKVKDNLIGPVTRVLFGYNGNVGIGTTSPAYRLDVQNTSGFDSRFKTTSLGGTVGILLEANNDFSGTSQAYIKAILGGGNGQSTLIFGTATNVGDITASEKMRITSGGNLLIGTTTDYGYKTVIAGNLYVRTGSAGTLCNITDGIAQTFQINTTSSGFDITNPNGGYISFSNTSEKMRITSGGNVGIGTTSPSNPLTVTGDIESRYTTSAATVNYLRLGTYSSGQWGSYIGAYSQYEATLNTDLRFGVSIGGTLTEAFRVGNGTTNVLIGTTTDAGYKLDVNGTGRFNGILEAAAKPLGTWTFIYSGNTTASNGYGMYGRAGTNSSDYNYYLTTSDGTTLLSHLKGNGDLYIKGAATFSSSVDIATSTGTTLAYLLTPSGWNGAKHRLTVPTSGNTSMWSWNWNGSARDYASYGSSNIQLIDNVITFSNGTGNPSEVARFSGTNLLIGTTTDAGYKLQVSGTGFFTSDLGIGGSFGTSPNNTILSLPNGVNIQSRIAVGVPQLAMSANIDGDWFSPTYKVSNYAGQIYIDANQGTIALRTAPTGTAGGAITWNTPAIYIANNSNVGIGTTSPATKLDVSGASGTYNGNSAVANFNSGTTSAVIQLQGSSTTNWFGIDGNGDAYIWANGSSQSYRFAAGGSERMRITSGGNVEIKGGELHIANSSGTLPSGGYTLDVNGTGRFSGDVTNKGTTYFGASSTGDIFVSPSSGYMYYEYPTSYGAIFRTQAGTQSLQLNASGAATFSSSVTTGGNITINGTTNGLNVKNAGYGIGWFAAAGAAADFSNLSAAGDLIVSIQQTAGYTANKMIVSNQNNGDIIYSFGTLPSNDVEKFRMVKDGQFQALTIKTAAPLMGAGVMKFGIKQAGTAVGAAGYWTVNIDGTDYYINLFNTSP